MIATPILASSLTFTDGSVVNVGLPAIAASFQADAGDLQWVVNAYLLPQCTLSARQCAIGFCAARGAATAAIGPVLGGWLIDIDATLWVAAPLSAVMLIARRPCP